ncbi:hypothetical protein GCM10027160_28670 [Streptomyces calidiresistens]|uniref:Aminoglycoside phosphotransferase domain-containing protein n=1 Tax=Streptomyces calidiresistens TaxID=1485586 RepID=A0A7W3XW28_9ACTN|nr:phosphotransferase [Streptomyces calidiresistens]MBB0229297.1 hypothetical protein [Streptomyces calidiresistens]
MYSPPRDRAIEQRMRDAFTTAAGALDVSPAGPPVWGWHGRTLARRVVHPTHGPSWLRMLAAPAHKAGGKLWEGTEAAAVFDKRVTKPLLHAIHDHTHGTTAYRAELTTHLRAPVCSPHPVIRAPLDLPDTWWPDLRADLAVIASTPTDRVAVRQEWIDRAVPAFTGRPAPQITHWATAHGDLHPGNISRAGEILDWEGWGRAPAGYDPALLLAYTLLEPATADRVRRTFADLLDTGPGRQAQLVVAAELLQSADRGDHPELVEPLRELVAGIIP